MPATDELGGLSSGQWRDLYDCAGRLEKLLREGAAVVDLRRFLPPPEAPHRRAVLYELIKTDLEARYRRGQACLLEDYLRCYPELGRPEDLPVSLLYEEYWVRSTLGDHPGLEAYRERFPTQFELLQRLVEQQPPEQARSTIHDTLRPPRSPIPDPAWQETLTSQPPEVPITPAPSGSGTPSAVPMPIAPGSGTPLLPATEGYQLLQRIGKGQFGEVFRALAPGGVQVAVKRIYRSMDDESSQRELKALERVRELRHPYLLQTHTYYALEDRLIIVMELADGSLQDRFKECVATGLAGIPQEQLLPYFAEAAEALDFLHAEKLSHRDIKPQNLLHLKGHAKVADFGIARSQEKLLDQTMDVGGTPAYMPPEMWRGEISLQSDQYSFALTWYEMRTGRRTFPDSSQLMLIAQHHLTDTPELAGVTEAEKEVLLRALAKVPEERFPSCTAFVEALKATTEPPKPALEAEPAQQVAPARGRGVKVMRAGLAIALVAAAVAVVVLWPRLTAPTGKGPEVAKAEVSWKPRGWDPEGNPEIVEDREGRRYYRRIARTVGGQSVVMVVVPQKAPNDPRTFYIMENKVWNDLYAAFMADPQSKQILKKYQDRPGCTELVQGQWYKGGWAEAKSELGLKGNGRLPVFRVTVTEAHCCAEWMGGLLPTAQEWRKAAGWGEDPRAGPFDGDPKDKSDLALGPLRNGPWSVDRGQRDVSIYRCRQMASNGHEWTRDLADGGGTKEVIPLARMNAIRSVCVVGKSYLGGQTLTFEKMGEQDTWRCTLAGKDISFRVVLEQ